MSTVTVVGVGKESRTKIGPMVMIPEKGAPFYWNYLEDYRPCAGGLSVENVIGTQLRDLITSGLTRWRLTVQIKRCSRGKERKAGCGGIQ